jgi:hypothetical protein
MSAPSDIEVSVLKTLWGRDNNGRWEISDLKGIALKPQAGFALDFFKFESQIDLLTGRPRGNIDNIFSTFGTTDFLMKQSILPVVSWNMDENIVRCIGTASVLSCTGYLLTACHVLLDPKERKYGDVVRHGNTLHFGDGIQMGVFIPLNPARGARALHFLPFEKYWYWGEWKESPLFHEPERFIYLTDIAICKIPQLPNDVAHQPLTLSLNPFKQGEKAYALGYALMDDISIEIKSGQVIVKEFTQDIFVSVGEVMDVFPRNHLEKNVPTPGPCFDFKARIPGKMSGGPILGAQGAVVRGVVSRSFSGETHAYGAMLGPTMDLPLDAGTTLNSLMASGNEGIPKIQGKGL